MHRNLHPFSGPLVPQIVTIPLSKNTICSDFDLQPNDWARLSNLCGPFNWHLKQVEQSLGVNIHNRGNHFSIQGREQMKEIAIKLLKTLYDSTKKCQLTPDSVHLHLQQANLDMLDSTPADNPGKADEDTLPLKPRGINQKRYLENIERHTLNFGVGPAGTGKTYLAVACAVRALNEGLVKHLTLVRPAVEAGEHLGFLPGDFSQKLAPYLKPLYDALCDFIGFERVNTLIDDGTIEIAPLAYMRGRSLNKAFIILDEAQNTTREQMKMFLTRIGFGSFAVVTGDITQVDLPDRHPSGLAHALEVLKNVNDIGVTFFSSYDVTRHALVKDIIAAYEHDENGNKKESDKDATSK